VHSTSKKLLYQLDHLVHVCNQPGMEISAHKLVHNEAIKCAFKLVGKLIKVNDDG
jgi:hypothetical protein